MIDPKDFDDIDDYWQAMADRFTTLTISDLKEMSALTSDEPTAELSLELEDYFL
jgi:hypothetical protein|tara:strand:+ start:359 stop:520 length:162 start_codon:yes stop_codon:yes gene_type:complete